MVAVGSTAGKTMGFPAPQAVKPYRTAGLVLVLTGLYSRILFGSGVGLPYRSPLLSTPCSGKGSFALSAALAGQARNNGVVAHGSLYEESRGRSRKKGNPRSQIINRLPTFVEIAPAERRFWALSCSNRYSSLIACSRHLAVASFFRHRSPDNRLRATSLRWL